MSYHALDTLAIGNDTMMHAARMWAPVNPTPMTFEPGFVLERALTPQPVPLHVQWWLEDASRAMRDLSYYADGAICALAILSLFFLAVSVWRGWQVAELKVEVADLKNSKFLHSDARAGLLRIRDALVQRRYLEAFYQCERAMEGR